MKRSAEVAELGFRGNPPSTVAEQALTSKRRRQSFSSKLAGHLRPCFQAARRRCMETWRVPLFTEGKSSNDMLCCALKAGPDGCLWYASYSEPGKARISVMTLDGDVEVVASGLGTNLHALKPWGGDLLFGDDGRICKAVRGGGVSVLVESNTSFFACYEHGILAVRKGQQHKILERRDTNGSLVETMELPFGIPGFVVTSARGDEIVCARGSQIWKVDLRTRKRVLIAGQEERGRLDGYGTDAQFHDLRSPCKHGNNHILIRDEQPDSTSRWCRVNLLTHEVTTVEILGLERMVLAGVAYEYPHLFAVTQDGVFYHSDLTEDTTATTFSEDVARLDWSEPMEAEFKLPGSVTVRADRRILCARSKYFAAMLSAEHGLQEAQSSVVDLSRSPLDVPAFRSVLVYLASDELSFLAAEDLAVSAGSTARECETEDILRCALFCLRVAALADQYQLQRLVRLAEAFVLNVAIPGRDCLVLPLLDQTLETGSAVERACFEAIETKLAAVLTATGSEEVTRILSRSPRLGAKLLFRIAKISLSVPSEPSDHET